MVADARDQQKNPTYTAFGYYTSFCPSQNKKVKPVIVTFLSHNLDFYFGIASLHLAIHTLSES